MQVYTLDLGPASSTGSVVGREEYPCDDVSMSLPNPLRKENERVKPLRRFPESLG